MAPPDGIDVIFFRIESDEFAVISYTTDYKSSPATVPGMLSGIVSLTPAEHQVVAFLLRGDSNAAIARTRGVSHRTVANQVAAIFQKLRVHSRRELRVWATNGGSLKNEG